MPVQIRPPASSDANDIAELLSQLGYPADSASVPDRLRQFGTQRNAIMWAAEQEGRVVGLATAHVVTSLHKSEPVAMLTVLVVHQRARGHGIGRQLVGTAEAWARERLDAHEFYKALGYEQTGVRLAKSLR
jgi:GNAT superfamily N-acetyltransferase